MSSAAGAAGIHGPVLVTGAGSGIGLSIVKHIVEAHGGTISAENRPEGGACVFFTLPKGVPPIMEEESA